MPASRSRPRTGWHGYDLPLLVNMQPAGKYLGERFHRAGGVPAVIWELIEAGQFDGDALTVTGRSQAENVAGREATDRDVIFPFDAAAARSAPASSSCAAICSTSRS